MDFANKRVRRSKIQKFQMEISSCSLPHDIVREILSRLPGSSISRFRFVCKQWLTLINTDPTLLFKVRSPNVIIHSYRPKNKEQPTRTQLTLLDTEGGPNPRPVKINQTLNRMSTSCNGLVCLYNSCHVTLFNPTTQQRYELPEPTKAYNSITECYLGYQRTMKQYKVLRFYYGAKTKQYQRQRQSQCEVYTIGSSSWRQITINFELGHDSRGFCVNNIGGVCINGTMYWKVRSYRPPRWEIRSFDVHNEKFETISTPWTPSDDLWSISQFEGCLCARVNSRSLSAYTELWVQENTTIKNWICKGKSEIVPDLYALHKERIKRDDYDRLKHVFTEGKILVQIGNDLHYGDFETGVNFGKIYGDEFGCVLNPQFYVQNFVKLPSEGQALEDQA